MAKKQLKKCSKSLVIREMQIKMTLRFHLIPIRMAKIKFLGDNTYWRGCGEREILFHCWWDCQLVQPLWKSIWRFLRKLEIYLPKDTAIPLLGIYPKDAPPCHRGTYSIFFLIGWLMRSLILHKSHFDNVIFIYCSGRQLHICPRHQRQEVPLLNSVLSVLLPRHSSPPDTSEITARTHIPFFS